MLAEVLPIEQQSVALEGFMDQLAVNSYQQSFSIIVKAFHNYFFYLTA